MRNAKPGQLLEAMAQASAEQSGAMDQMTGALWDMTRLTQENAALVDRLGEAAVALFREAVDHVQQASGMGRASGP
jgi:methyl-accepting chemotaxis protein